MAVNIIRASLAERENLLRLFHAIGERSEMINGKFFESDGNIILLAYAGQEPAGFLYAYMLDPVHKERPLMFLYSIDVLQQFQKRGIGTALIEKLKELSVQMGCSEMFVLTNDSNHVAKKTYEKTGGRRENPDDVMYVYPFE